MNPRNLITGLVLVLAAAGLVAALLGDGDGPAAGTDDSAAGPAAGTAAGTDAAPDAPDAPDQDALEATLPRDGVVVYYFHGYKRCVTCNKIEALAEETLWQRHADLLGAGTVVFQPVNIETDAHRHFIEDYQLHTKVVVMSVRRGGQEVDWRRLDEVWQRVGDEADYRDYIAANLAACLRELDPEAG